jgi:tetratricopeptide (TPR) repeat protein
MLDCQIFGLNAGLHHLTNVILHIINTLLLFAVFHRMTGAVWQSGFVAALFAIHPFHVESVAWVSERKDVLSTMFWMLTLLGYQYYVKRPNVSRYLLVLLLFAMALMSKPMVVTLPFVLLLLDYWPLDRFQKSGAGRLILEKTPLFILSAILCIVTIFVQKIIGAVIEVSMLAPNIRITNAFISYVKYIAKMVWPIRLAVFYPHGVEGIPIWQGAAAAFSIIVVLVLVIWPARRHKYLLTGFLWYLGTLVPVIGFIQVGSQAMADRYTYISLTGLFIMIGWGVPALIRSRHYKQIILGTCAGTVFLALSICSWFQVGYWRSGVELFKHSLKVTGGNSIAHYLLANSLQFEGKSNEAITHYYNALSFNPDYTNARCNLANTLKEQGSIDEAIGHYRKVLKIQPDDAAVHNNLANAFQSQGNLAEAIEHYHRAIEAEPGLFEAYANLGLVLKETEQFDEAIEHFQKAVRINPNHPVPFDNMAKILITHPDDKKRNVNQAIALAGHAVKLTNYQNSFTIETLAAGYAATGKFDIAIEVAKAALELAIEDQNEKLANRLREKIKHYQQGRP